MMKINYPVLCFFFGLFLLVSCIYDINLPDTISGNGIIIIEERKVANFKEIKVRNGIDIFLKQGETERLVIEADENLHPYIDTKVENGCLKISSTKNISMAKSCKIYLMCRNLNSIDLTSSGNVKSVNPIRTDFLNIDLSSSGGINLKVDVNTAVISISSSGNAKISGKSKNIEADLSSSGNLKAFDLKSNFADVDVSSSGNAYVSVSNKAKFQTSSSGDIVFTGDPKIIVSNRSSSGNIIKK